MRCVRCSSPDRRTGGSERGRESRGSARPEAPAGPSGGERVNVYTPQEQANLHLVRQMYEQVLQRLDPAPVDRFFHPGYVQHSPMAATGAQGLKEFLEWARRRSPAAEHRIKRMFADGDHVIVHVHVVINPGDRGNAVVDIFRIEGGLIAEHWDVGQEVPARAANDNGMF